LMPRDGWGRGLDGQFADLAVAEVQAMIACAA
jgi:hypothetical protein